MYPARRNRRELPFSCLSSENTLSHQAVAAGFSLRPKLSSHVRARKLKFAATTGLAYFHAPLCPEGHVGSLENNPLEPDKSGNYTGLQDGQPCLVVAQCIGGL